MLGERCIPCAPSGEEWRFIGIITFCVRSCWVGPGLLWLLKGTLRGIGISHHEELPTERPAVLTESKHRPPADGTPRGCPPDRMRRRRRRSWPQITSGRAAYAHREWRRLRARGEAVAEPPVTFAALLRKLRTKARLTQEELAEAARLSPRSVSDLERGIAATPRRETIRLLADALGLAGPARAEFEAIARGRTPGGAGTGGAAAATRTLPRDIASFTGRQQELAELVEAAAGAGMTWRRQYDRRWRNAPCWPSRSSDGCSR